MRSEENARADRSLCFPRFSLADLSPKFLSLSLSFSLSLLKILRQREARNLPRRVAREGKAENGVVRKEKGKECLGSRARLNGTRDQSWRAYTRHGDTRAPPEGRATRDIDILRGPPGCCRWPGRRGAARARRDAATRRRTPLRRTAWLHRDVPRGRIVKGRRFSVTFRRDLPSQVREIGIVHWRNAEC